MSDILDRLKSAAAMATAGADNENYCTNITIREAREAAEELTRLRAEVQQQADELERLRGVVGKLPNTADGVPVVPGMRVYWDSADPKSMRDGYVVDELTIWPREEDGEFNGNACTRGMEDGVLMGLPDDFGLYSTREAAEAARGQG